MVSGLNASDYAAREWLSCCQCPLSPLAPHRASAASLLQPILAAIDAAKRVVVEIIGGAIEGNATFTQRDHA